MRLDINGLLRTVRAAVPRANRKDSMDGKIWEFPAIRSINVPVNSSSGQNTREGPMTRIFLLLLVALILAPTAFAQNRRDDYSFYEFYVGYAHERANNNADRFDKNGRATFNGRTVDFVSEKVNYNGFNAEFNQNVTRHIGIVTSFTGTYNTTGYFDARSGRTFNARVQRYDLMAGPRSNWRPSRVTPFVEGLVGISHQRARFGDTLSARRKSDTRLALALGGRPD